MNGFLLTDWPLRLVVVAGLAGLALVWAVMASEEEEQADRGVCLALACLQLLAAWFVVVPA